MQGSYLTLYSRISFGITPEMDVNRHLRLTVDYDDACIVFLDGAEVYRSPNIPTTDPTSVFRIDSVRVPENESVEIRFTARANKSYTVEYSDSLATGSWQKLEDVATDPLERPGFTVTDSPPVEAKSRFYRLVTPQKL